MGLYGCIDSRKRHTSFCLRGFDQKMVGRHKCILVFFFRFDSACYTGHNNLGKQGNSSFQMHLGWVVGLLWENSTA